jgi:hypothetical protein
VAEVIARLRPSRPAARRESTGRERDNS